MDAILTEEDERKSDIQSLASEFESLKEEILKRDVQIQDLEGKFNQEKEKSDKLLQLLKVEDKRKQEGEELVQRLEYKLQETGDSMHEMRETISFSKEDSTQSTTLNNFEAKMVDGENAIREIQKELTVWKQRCEHLELTPEREVFQEENQQHEQDKFKLSQSGEILRDSRENTFGKSEGDIDVQHQEIITELTTSLEDQSERNVELNQQLRQLRRQSLDTDKVINSLRDQSEKDQKLIVELNSQNEQEYQKNEKLKRDAQRLKKDIDGWRKIQSDMKSQYQDIRSMYDDVCKQADDQKREMLEMTLVMDRDKRAIARQRDEIEKLKIRVTSLKQSYDDLKQKYDENFILLESKTSDVQTLTSQLQSAKKNATELSASNKDLKKRTDFSQKEVIAKHRLLQVTQEKVTSLERSLEEKHLESEEAKKIVKEAKDKAERFSQEALAKEKDSKDRIALIENFQSRLQQMEDELKSQNHATKKLNSVITEKEEALMQMSKELKSEKQRSQAIFTDFKEDIKILEHNLEDEKEKSTLLRKDVEEGERKFKIEKESFLQDLEELQVLLSEAKQEKLKDQEKMKKLESEMEENERQRVKEIEEFEETKHKILSEKNTDLTRERQEIKEELKQELESKKQLLDDTERQLTDNTRIYEKEKRQFRLVLNEKDDLLSSLRRENQELKRRWVKESQWMEENTIEESAQSLYVDKRTEISPDHVLTNEAHILASQNIAIQKLKQQIDTEHNLEKLLSLTEHSDDLDFIHSSQDKESTKTERLKTAVEKLFIVLLLSPMAYFFSCEFFLTFAAVLIPLAYLIHQKPWNNCTEQEKVLGDAFNSLSMRLAVESTDNDNLRKTIDNLTKQGFKEGLPYNSNNNGEVQDQIAEGRHKLIEELEKQSKEEHEKQKEELLSVKQKQEADKQRLRRQQEIQIKSRLGQFWGYEKLKFAINQLKHEREADKDKSNGEDTIVQKRVAEAIEEAVGKEKKRKLETLAMMIFLFIAFMLCLTVNSFSFFSVVCCITATFCSIFYGIHSWKEINYVKYKLQSEEDIVEAQAKEIRELCVLMDKEHDVVNKQKQAIEALERRLTEEYKKNKDYQLMIARLTWVVQEGEEMKNIVHQMKRCPTGMPPKFELDTLAKDHAREKCSIFQTMQKQLEEQSSRTVEQRKVIDDLKKASEAIVSTAERQIAEIKTQNENRHCKSKTFFKRFLSYKVLLCVSAVVSTLAAIFQYNKTALGLSAVFALVFGISRLAKAKKHNQQRLDEFYPTKAERSNLRLSVSSVKQYGYDIVFIGLLALMSYHIWGLSFHIVVICFGAIVPYRMVTHFVYTRSINKDIKSWNKVVEDLRNQVHEKSQLIDAQTEEIQTLKKLLEVERSYSQHSGRLLKEAKESDKGFQDLAEMGKFEKKANQLDAEGERLVNYELVEMKNLLEEEQRASIQLRKELTEVEKAKRVLSSDVTCVQCKLEIKQVGREELLAAKQKQCLLKDRIEELMDELEAEQRTKQELNARLIEERSARELKQIELQDLREKIKDEKQTQQNLRELVVPLSNKDKEMDALRQELYEARQEADEDRLTTQRYSLVLIETTHKLREQNMDLQRQIDDDKNIGKIREKSENQQEEIEKILSLLEDMTSQNKALKYQDRLGELQLLREKLDSGEKAQPNVFEELEVEREKNRILEEAVEELQQQDQQRRRAIELARQLSGENIPIMVEEDTSEEEFEDELRGVLYWLGTNGGLTEWQNPAESGLVLITRSSYGHGKATDVANRQPCWCSTSDKPNQWWKIDFGEKRLVVPTAYSLRHGWSGSAGALRHWVLEASVDGREWVVLRQHVDDKTLNKPYGSGYWELANQEDQGYRFIRVRQTEASANGSHALRLCGFEVYGKLVIE